MTKIIELDPGSLIPAQSELYFTPFKNFLINYLKHPSKVLIPVKEYRDNYIIIDGHHRSAAIDLLRQSNPNHKLFGQIITSRKEEMDPPPGFYSEESGIYKMNNNIKMLYDCLIPSDQYSSIKDMRKDYRIESPAKVIKALQENNSTLLSRLY